MKKMRIFLIAATLLLSGQSFAQTTKATIQGEISSSTANGLLGGTILNNIVLSYVDWTTCSGTGGIVYWNAGIPTCLNAGTNGYTLTMVSGIPQWTLPASQSANTVYAGPSSGSPATPSFRALVGSDLPNPSSSTLGGVQSAAAVSHQWINSISTSGVPQLSQPAFTDISGTLAVSAGGTGATSAANAIINLMPTPTRAGDLAYWNGTNWVTFPGNNSGSQYLTENGSGVPSWAASSTAGVSALNTLTGALSITAGTGISVVPAGSTIQVGFSTARATLPTQQTFLSGSGTYTTPANVLWIRVRMVGGGGGGGGAGTGGTGGNTTFGTSLLAANGGGGGVNGGAGATGGSASLGSGPIGIALTGGSGDAAHFVLVSTTQFSSGGIGGSSVLGGAGSGGYANIAGNAGVTNTGGGGGGGSTTSVASVAGGAGGGAGGFVDAIINSPSATYAYAVGAAGSAGANGSNNYSGGLGGSGAIWVEEHYN